MLTILIYVVAFLTFGSELFGNNTTEKMKIGDIYIHTITNTRLRVEEIVDERKRGFYGVLETRRPGVQEHVRVYGGSRTLPLSGEICRGGTRKRKRIV